MSQMVTQKELARRFARGHDSGTASNLAIVRDGDVSHLVGYGWAIYATRDEADERGPVTVYEDAWREWARERGGQATHSQFAEIRKGLKEAFNRKDGEHPSTHALCTYNSEDRPTWADPPSSVNRVGELRGR